MHWNLRLIGGSEILIYGLTLFAETELSVLYSKTFQFTTTAQKKGELRSNVQVYLNTGSKYVIY
jgi:hypothetical protein